MTAAAAAASLVITLDTVPPQLYRGFSDGHPLVAHSVATHPTAVAPHPTPQPALPAVSKWLGIPFATAQRWAKPIPYALPQPSPDAAPLSNATPVDAFEFGPVPWQPEGIVEKHWVDKEGWLNRDFVGMSEDCLNCNVFVPQATRDKGHKIPVMVW